jgi:hypothetical protein
MTAISAILEAEGSCIRGQSKAKVVRLYQKTLACVAQVVECLLGRYEALGSVSSAVK